MIYVCVYVHVYVYVCTCMCIYIYIERERCILPETALARVAAAGPPAGWLGPVGKLSIRNRWGFDSGRFLKVRRFLTSVRKPCP